VEDGEHPHPAAQQAERVDGVQQQRAAGHLHVLERASLCRSQALHLQRQMIDLSLHDADAPALPLRTAPDLPFRPHRQLTRFMHGGMINAGHRIGQGQIR